MVCTQERDNILWVGDHKMTLQGQLKKKIVFASYELPELPTKYN